MATSVTPPAASGPQPSQIQYRGPLISFQAQNVPPSQYIYLQDNDAIVIRYVTNHAAFGMTMQYRYLTPQGEVKEGTHNFVTNINGNSFESFQLGECWLISFALTGNNPQPAGSWQYAQVFVSRGFNPVASFQCHGMLWEGYLNAQTFQGWPGSPSQRETDGAGTLRSVLGTLPGAGADISEVVPSNRRWTLLAFTAVLTTSATVANRIVDGVLDDGTNTYHQSAGLINQTASTVLRYCFAPYLLGAGNLFGGQPLGMPQFMQLKSGYHIKTLTSALQAGDQWSAPEYLIQEWGSFDS